MLIAAVGVIVLTDNDPFTLIVLPLSLSMESTSVWLPPKRANEPGVPPAVVTLPPRPTQLPALVHTS